MTNSVNSLGTNIALAIGVLLASALLVYLVFAFVQFNWRWYATIGEWGRILAAISWLVVAGVLRRLMSVVGR